MVELVLNVHEAPGSIPGTCKQKSNEKPLKAFKQEAALIRLT